MRGLQVACRKRPVSQDALERVADSIEAAMNDTGEREISTQTIGTMVMARLRDLDPSRTCDSPRCIGTSRTSTRS